MDQLMKSRCAKIKRLMNLRRISNRRRNLKTIKRSMKMTSIGWRSSGKGGARSSSLTTPMSISLHPDRICEPFEYLFKLCIEHTVRKQCNHIYFMTN